MNSIFQWAFFLYLTDRKYRPRMISCGVEALQNGIDGHFLSLLAGADFEDDESLLNIFLGASREVAVSLPAPDQGQEEDWLTIKIIQYRHEGRDVPLHIDDEFNRNLRFVHRRLSRSLDSPLVDWAKHFAQWCNNSLSTAYPDWENILVGKNQTVRNSDVADVHKQIVNNVTMIITGVAYGGLDQFDLDESQRIVEMCLAACFD